MKGGQAGDFQLLKLSFDILNHYKVQAYLSFRLKVIRKISMNLLESTGYPIYESV